MVNLRLKNIVVVIKIFSMMSEYDKILNKWKNQKCIGSCILLHPYKAEVLISEAIKKMIAKNNNIKIIIVVDCFDTRCNIIKAIVDNKIPKDDISIISFDYIKNTFHYRYDVAFIVGLTNYDLANHVLDCVKYKLFIITSDKLTAYNKDRICKYLPCVNTANYDDLNKVRFRFPVEEHRIAVNFANIDDKKQYDDYTTYIDNVINTFGSFEMIEYARIGNKATGQSAESVRATIAEYNGWKPDMNTTIPYLKSIDDVFNPNTLAETAATAYNIIRYRRELICNYKAKVNSIIKLLNNELKDKKVLIVSKSGEYANFIASELNANNIPCGCYHNDIENSAIYDDEIADYIRYKTGANKGEIKTFGATSLSKYWLQRFDLSLSDKLNLTKCINVLSIKNYSSDELKCSVDAVIFTSGLYASVDEFRYRFKDVKFNTDVHPYYKLYLRSTVEERNINDEKVNYKRTIIADNANKYVVETFDD